MSAVNGKVVLITGGGRGVGAEVALTTSVEACGKAFVKGIEARKRYVYCPEHVSLMRWLKPLLSTRLGEAATLKSVPELLPQMDAEVEALGRSLSARTQKVEKK